MAGTVLKTNFAVENKYAAFYMGGKVQYSEDGEYMFCQCGHQVQIIEVKTGKTLHAIGQDDDDDEVSSFVLSPDNEIFVVASRSLLLRQWKWKEKTITRTWKAVNTAPISCMTFDCTSTLLACGSADSTIKVYDVLKQYYTHNLRGHQGVVSVAEFHPDISRLQLYTAADDYKILVWNLQTSTCIASLDSHYSVVTALQFDGSGNTLYSGGRDNVVHVWDVQDFSKKKTLPIYESVEWLLLLSGEEEALNVTNKEPHFITAGSKGLLKVWNGTTGQCVYTQSPSSAFTQDGTLVKQAAIVGACCVPALGAVSVVRYDHRITLYHSEDLTLKKEFSGYNDDILDVKFIGDGDTHVAVATNSELIKVFEVETWSCQTLSGHTDIVVGLDVSDKGTLLASGSKDNTIRVWKMDRGSGEVCCVATGTGHTKAVGAVALPRLRPTFVVSGSEDLTLKLWDLPEEFEEGEVISLQSRYTEKAHDKDINSIAVAPNDRLLATGSQDKTAKLWNTSNLSLIGVFRGHKRGIWCVQFSTVDQCLATASADSTIKIWALSDFSCVKTFEGHESSVLRVQFITHGMQLLSSGSDGLLKLWTIKSNECVKTLDEHEAKMWALAVDDTEKRVVTGAGDSNIILWKDVTQEEVDERIAKQEDAVLKEQELSNLLHKKKYLKAIGLAITLEHPFRVLNILKEILAVGQQKGKLELKKTICKLRTDQIDAVLRFASKWNTNSKHCHVAQFVLNIVLHNYTAQELLQFPNIKSSLEGMVPYTERHFQRMGRLMQQSMFVDYTLQSMKLITGYDGSKEAEDNTDTSRVLEQAKPEFSLDRSSSEARIAGGRHEDHDSEAESGSENENRDSENSDSENDTAVKKTVSSKENSPDLVDAESSDLESSSDSYDEIPSDDSDEVNKEIYSRLLKNARNVKFQKQRNCNSVRSSSTREKPAENGGNVDDSLTLSPRTDIRTNNTKNKVSKTPLTTKRRTEKSQKKSPRTEPLKRHQLLPCTTQAGKTKRRKSML